MSKAFAKSRKIHKPCSFLSRQLIILVRSEFTASGTAGKAWRFEGEMLEIAKTFLDAELPDGFHKASSEIYKRMADFKDSEEKIIVERVIKKILN